MNEEKQIAQAIIDAQKMREDSYIKKTRTYKQDIESCLIITCKKNDVSPNLWSLLTLAMHWWNDIQLWAEDILAGRDISMEDSPCCDASNKDKCDRDWFNFIPFEKA